MNTYDLIVNPAAELDMRLAKAWYDLQKEGLGTEFLLQIDKAFARITAHPLQFPLVKKNIRKTVVRRFLFSIFFTLHEKKIIVFAVFHNNRNPITWKKRSE